MMGSQGRLIKDKDAVRFRKSKNFKSSPDLKPEFRISPVLGKVIHDQGHQKHDEDS